MGAEDVERQRLNVFRYAEIYWERLFTLWKQAPKPPQDAKPMQPWFDEYFGSLHAWDLLSVHTLWSDDCSCKFQKVIKEESQGRQIFDKCGNTFSSDCVIARSGGSNAIGAFSQYGWRRLVGLKLPGGLDTDQHAATMTKGSVGVVDGKEDLRCLFWRWSGGADLLISAGREFGPGVGPEHAFFKDASWLSSRIRKVRQMMKLDACSSWHKRERNFLPASKVLTPLRSHQASLNCHLTKSSLSTYLVVETRMWQHADYLEKRK